MSVFGVYLYAWWQIEAIIGLVLAMLWFLFRTPRGI